MDSQSEASLVQVAYLHSHTVSHSFHESLMRLVAYDAAHSGRIIRTDGPFMIRADSGGLCEARNLAVQRFLDDTDHPWLWMVDTDMGFLPDTVDRLVETAEAIPARVVGGLCFGWREGKYDGFGGRRCFPAPTIFDLAETQDVTGFATRWTYPVDSVIRVAGTGAACLLIHRDVLAKIRADMGDVWFDRGRYSDQRMVSEDLSFCFRCGKIGEPLYVHTGIKTTHHKQLWVSEADYLPAMRYMSAQQGGDEKGADNG